MCFGTSKQEEEDVAIGALAHSKKDHLLSVSQVVVQQRIARRLKEVVAGEYKLICKVRGRFACANARPALCRPP